ncbi:DoxX family protein [Microbacterium sp. 2FI]|uniref:DoxX family protein n=1 Tax=Microbacterium sp. 2FI TaxID=2502193 RepID=UPI0010F8D837|nr:DoxX family protein [Microbacterium sp. 2FI]
MKRVIFGSNSNSRLQDITLLFGRVSLGIVLIAHGWQKFAVDGIDGVGQWFGSLGIPMPIAAAAFAATVELLGGILLILGLAVRVVGPLIAIDMLGAFIFVHAANGLFVIDGGWEFVLVVATLALVIAGLGAGRIAVDPLIVGRRVQQAEHAAV